MPSSNTQVYAYPIQYLILSFIFSKKYILCTLLGKDKRKSFQYEIQMNSLGFTTDMAFHILPLCARFPSLASFSCLLFLYVLTGYRPAIPHTNLFHYTINRK